ncbi:transcription factor PRE4-like [Juglans microcarpa x Juglans regia]|uniref:transcription factor PRE4-like n=1 Tax=Juglans microcarpa x Juglans regia TaxID=2249226 RepID=UPI001B7EA4A8|nr:transcription factor PRE4-like [Juglans microcarpa x Juglans regia]
MSSRRSRTSINVADDQEIIENLVFKLQSLLPDQPNQRHKEPVSASKILNEICTYIKSLQKEADDLSERLSRQLHSVDTTGDVDVVDVEFIRRLLQH